MIYRIAKGYLVDDATRRGFVYDYRYVDLNPVNNLISLKKDQFSSYPTTAQVVRFPAFRPKAVRAWTLIGATVTEPPGPFGATSPCTVRFRVGNGTTDLYWSGTAWITPPSASHWNTIEEIQAGTPSFPLATRVIQIVARLATTSSRVTPVLEGVQIIWNADVTSYEEEYLIRTLRRAIQAGSTFEADHVVQWATTGTTFDLGAYLIGPRADDPAQNLNLLKGVGGIYLRATDPELLTSKLSGYNTGTRVITATQSITAGTQVLIRTICEPVVVYATHLDYIEVPSLPAISIGPINQIGQFRSPTRAYATPITSGTAKAVRSPTQVTWSANLHVMASRVLDQTRVMTAVRRFLDRTPVLTSEALDDSFTVTIERPSMTPLQDSGAHMQRSDIPIVIHGTSMWLAAGEDLSVARDLDFGATPIV